MTYYFLPGLGADKRLFDGLEKLQPAVHVDYIEARPKEALSDYSARLMRSVGYQACDVLVGFSFGGICALEMAKHRPAKAVVLISGLRSFRGNTSLFKLQTYLMSFVPSFLLKRLIQSLMVNQFSKDPLLSELQRQKLADMALDLDITFFRWAATACAKWQGDFIENPCDSRIIPIHGEKDRIIPREKLDDVHVVSGGNHLIQYTHTQQVLDLIDHTLAEMSG